MAGRVSRNLRAIAIGGVIWLGFAAAVAVGSWQHAKGPVNERPQPLATIAGFTTYAVPSAKFTIAVPAAWRVFTAEEVLRDAYGTDKVKRENPELAVYLDVLDDPRSPVKLVAGDATPREGFTVMAIVIAQAVPPGYSLADLIRESESEIGNMPAQVGDLQSDLVKLPAGDAQRISYRARLNLNGAVTAAVTQYGLVANGRAYVLTYTTLPEFAAEYEADFVRSAMSFGAD
jgi:hypothetical protein